MDLLIWRAAAGVCAAIWIYLFLFRGFFWRISTTLPHSSSKDDKQLIAVVIPARDEAVLIGRAIATLKVQRKVRLHIIVADDESTDGTAEAALKAGADQVVPVSPRPAGWKGKLWALEQGARAVPGEAEFILFMDADIALTRDNVVARLLAQSRRGYDLVSIMANLRCQSPSELLLIPAFVYFFFKLYPPDWVERRKGPAAAAGGCMFIRRDTLSKLGGIESYRNELIDDCALARRVKAVGGRLWLGVSNGGVISTRGYNEASVIRRMIARSAFTQLNHSALLLLGAMLGMALTYLLPVALLFAPDPLVMASGVVTLLISILMFQPVLREFGAPAWPAFLLPGIAMYYMVATVESAVNYWGGRGGEWKGRVQDAK